MKINTNSEAAGSIKAAIQAWVRFRLQATEESRRAKGEPVQISDTHFIEKADSQIKDLCIWLDSRIKTCLENQEPFQTQSPSLRETFGRLHAVTAVENYQTDLAVYQEAAPRDRKKFLADLLEDVLMENEPGVLTEWEPRFMAKVDSCAGILLAEPILETFENLNPKSQDELMPIYRAVNVWSTIFEPLIKERILDDEIDPEIRIRYALLLNTMGDAVSPSETHVDALVNLWKASLGSKPKLVCDNTGQFYPLQFFASIRSIPEHKYLAQFASRQLAGLENAREETLTYRAELLEVLAKMEKIEFNQGLLDSLMLICGQADYEEKASILKILLSIDKFPEGFDSSSIKSELTEFIQATDTELPELRKLALLALYAIPALREDAKQLLSYVESAEPPNNKSQELLNSTFLFAPIDSLVREFLSEETEDGGSHLALANNISARISINPVEKAVEQESFIQDLMGILASKIASAAKAEIKRALLMLGEASLREAFQKIISPNKDDYRQGLLTLRLFYNNDRTALSHYFEKHIEEIRKITVSEPAIEILAKKDLPLLNYLSGHGLKLVL